MKLIAALRPAVKVKDISGKIIKNIIRITFSLIYPI